MSEKETTYINISNLNNELANLLIGKLKTLVDALMENERQAKAFKDMLSSTIWEIENTRSTGVGRILYACEKNGVPMLPDWIVKQISVEMGF